jgi:hypothetical protein
MIGSGRLNLERDGGNGMTPLMSAAKLNSLSAVELLIGAGANVKALDSKGNTALHYVIAARAGSGAIAEALIKAGAKIDAKNSAGVAPFQVASASNDIKIDENDPSSRQKIAAMAAPTDPVVMALGLPELTGITAKETMALRRSGHAPTSEQTKVSVVIPGTKVAAELVRRQKTILQQTDK